MLKRYDDETEKLIGEIMQAIKTLDVNSLRDTINHNDDSR